MFVIAECWHFIVAAAVIVTLLSRGFRSCWENGLECSDVMGEEFHKKATCNFMANQTRTRQGNPSGNSCKGDLNHSALSNVGLLLHNADHTA